MGAIVAFTKVTNCYAIYSNKRLFGIRKSRVQHKKIILRRKKAPGLPALLLKQELCATPALHFLSFTFECLLNSPHREQQGSVASAPM